MTRISRRVFVSVVVAVLWSVSGCTSSHSDGQGGAVSDSSSPPPAPTARSSPSGGDPPGGAVVQRLTAALPQPDAAQLRTARSVPVEDPYYPDVSNPEVDALHYALGLRWDGETLTGDTRLTFRATTATAEVRLALLDAMQADMVQLDGHVIDYQQSRDTIAMSTGSLDADSTHTLEIVYSGTPHPVPAPSQRVDTTDGLGWNIDPDGSVYTLQEPYGAFTWYPVNDHPSDKALYDAVVSTISRDVAVFNGELLSGVRHADQTTSRWHLDEPAASYLVTLAIGPYRRSVVTTPSGMNISYWVRRDDRDLLPSLQREGSRAFEWLRTHAGRYPFSTLGVVVVGGSSAMETQTLITMSRAAVERPDAVLEHEMAHQWYGDSVTPRNWKGMWLNEGWAMYMQQWYERDSGRPVYAGGMSRWRRLDQPSRRRSGPPADYDRDRFGDVNVYLGPAMMLDAIRSRIGDAAFEKMARAWPAQHQMSTVDRAVFTRWLQRFTGVDLRRLMHRWLDSARTPALPGR
ncbi:MAG: M1 family metallopeptidase [Propionibacteriales bacterium]|nr:M1 family metallopeptidase [Propionibacteriales bacterium]